MELHRLFLQVRVGVVNRGFSMMASGELVAMRLRLQGQVRDCLKRAARCPGIARGEWRWGEIVVGIRGSLWGWALRRQMLRRNRGVSTPLEARLRLGG